MLRVLILMVGKTREPFIQEGVAFYQKRLKPYLKLSLKSVKEEKETKNLSPDLIMAREGERLRAQIPPKAHVVALNVGGKQFTSEDFAAWLTKRELTAQPLAFLIGGHWGLDEATVALAHEGLALSRFTLTHELSRLVLLEQLYRAMTIKTGHPYHA
jgi:23S rRNA (pseudouridine1915-N3)-methyltransferase